MQYKVNDLSEIVNIFLDKTDNNGRYLSYEYCFNYFNEHCDNPTDDDRNMMTLYLYTYLASWGMLRNSFLLYKDPFFNRRIIDLLIDAKNNKTDILQLKKDIVNTYKYKDPVKQIPNTYFKEEKECNIDPKEPDTLVSKIILGTLGTLPAFDRFYRKTAKNLGFSQYINKNSITQISQFISDNSTEINNIINDFKMKKDQIYTKEKIVDIYFWQKAYNLSPIDKILDNNKKNNKDKIKDIINNLNNKPNKSKILEITRDKWYKQLLPLLPNLNKQEVEDTCNKIIKEYYTNALK